MQLHRLRGGSPNLGTDSAHTCLQGAHQFELKMSNNATSALALWAEGLSQDEEGPGSSWAAPLPRRPRWPGEGQQSHSSGCPVGASTDLPGARAQIP